MEICDRETYIANCTFPSLSPPITRESRYDANDVDWIHLYTNEQVLISRAAPKLTVAFRGYIHKGREYIANHCDEEHPLAAVLVTERPYAG